MTGDSITSTTAATPTHSHAQAGQVRHAEEHGGQRGGRPEVWLLGDEQERHGDHRRTAHHVPEVRGAAASCAIEGRQHQRYGDSGELRGLQGESAEGNPAARPAVHRPEQGHVHQQGDERAIDQQ